MKSGLSWNPQDLCQLSWSFSPEHSLKHCKMWHFGHKTLLLLNKEIYLLIYFCNKRSQFPSLGRQLSLCCLHWRLRATLQTRLAPCSDSNLAGWAQLEQGPWCTQYRAEHIWQLGTTLLWSLGRLFAVMQTRQAISRLPSYISLCRLPVDTWLEGVRICYGPSCFW